VIGLPSRRTLAHMACTDHGGVNFYFERNGEGPPLLFISGTGGDLRVRPNGFDYPFTDGFDTVCYDQRGLGQTDQPVGPYSVAGYAEDAAAILDAVGFSAAAVVGVSFGGMVAQEVAIRYPDRVSCLVLACTSSGGPGGSSYPLHLLVDEGPEARVAISDSRWADPSFVDPIRDEAVARAASTPLSSAGARLQLEARSHHDSYSRLDQIACPTLVAGGRYDLIAPPKNAEALAARIPGAKLEFFEGGHSFLRQDPRSVEVVAAFLRAWRGRLGSR
jgi:3-oxoadipate enol-lactonase